MSLLTYTGTELVARELLRTLAGPIEDGDRDAARAVLDEIEALALDVADDEATILVRRDELDLTVRRLAAADVNAVAGYVIGRIEGIDHELGRQETRLLGRRAADRDEQERVGIRSRVLEALGEPARPAAVAERIGCDPSQISRAIRELVASGQVVAVEPTRPQGDDRRARWYQRVDVVARAA